VAYFDCFHGAAGDMLLASLLDAGLELAALERALAALPLTGYTLEHERTISHHVSGSRLHVRVHEQQPARAWADIRALLAASGLSEHTRARAHAVFERLAHAEAAVHGVPLDEVHFHEVGAVDSIVDTVGVCVALDLLDVEQVYASALPTGRGWVATQHGELPVPAPATLEILAAVGAPLLPMPSVGELLTPTAAALLGQLAQFQQPAMRVQRVGYGFGNRAFARLNGLRVWLGEADEAAAPASGQHYHDQHGYDRHDPPHHHAPASPATPTHAPDLPPQEPVVELHCNLDDATGELVAYTIEGLFAAGALDVWATPLVMKKGRPATQLSCLTHLTHRDKLTTLLLRETPTLGVRWEEIGHVHAECNVISVVTHWGSVRLKQKIIAGQIVGYYPEYEDCAKLARAHEVPLMQIYAAACAWSQNG
jgi:hypothetical protein